MSCAPVVSFSYDRDGKFLKSPGYQHGQHGLNYGEHQEKWISLQVEKDTAPSGSLNKDLGRRTPDR